MNLKAYRRASLTIEAAAALPLFMTGIIALISIMLMQLAAMRLQADLVMRSSALAIECADGHNESVTDVRDELADGLSKEDVRLIRNGIDGLDMTGSHLDDPEYIELALSCDLVPLTGQFGLLSVPFSRRCISHVWCGYDHGFFDNKEYVYVTNDSEVYHLDRDCTHIRLSVFETSSDEVAGLRNSSGARYRPCGICHAASAKGQLFVTPEGDRYHKSAACSALRRTVRAIRKSETGDKRPCSRCGR